MEQSRAGCAVPGITRYAGGLETLRVSGPGALIILDLAEPVRHATLHQRSLAGFKLRTGGNGMWGRC